MKLLLQKELKLAASPISYFFVLFAFMTLIPGYPILLGAFFICLGIFYSFQNAREANDILYTALLPIAKKDVVKCKFIFVVAIEGVGFLIMTILTLIRMTLLKNAEVYLNNALMNANLYFLAFVLLIFGAYNRIFLKNHFKTAYKIGSPFLSFVAVGMILVCLGESLHFFPRLGFINATDFEKPLIQIFSLLFGLVAFSLTTWLSLKKSIAYFEKVDL